MRNFGATAPPLAPEPASKEVDSNTGASSSTTGRGHDAGQKTAIKASDWPGGESFNTNVPPANMNLDFGGTGTPGAFQTGAFGGSTTNPVDVTTGTQRLAKELDDFVAQNSAGAVFGTEQGNAEKPSEDAIADLQLQTARKLRQLLPTNRELLNLVQERNWIPLLLGWLNLHDRPAVQVEALLALTNIAELCAHHSYYQHAQAQSSAAVAAAAAAQAAAAAAKAGVTNLPASTSSSLPPFYSYPPPPTIGDGNSATSSSMTTTYPYPSLLTPPQGQVPFPPLSFSQKMTPEALAALDATLTNTIQQSQTGTGTQSPKKAGSPNKASQTKGSSSSTPLSPLPPFSSLNSSFPPASLSPPAASSTPMSSFLSSTSSLSAAASSSSSPFLPPPTPVPSFGGGSNFPQQLSASSQHLLLRHADAIPTLISLLASPNREVYEQAMWILGSIAAGDSPGSNSHGGSSSSTSGDGGREKSVAARDVILAAGIMNQMLRCLEAHPHNLSLQRIGSWTLSNLVEGLFQQSSHSKSGSRNNDYSSCDEIDTDTLLPVLRRLLHMADAEVLSYTCWTLSHLCDGPSSHISAVVTTRDGKGKRGGLVPRLVELLIHPSWRVTKPALRTIGNIVCAECSDDNNHGSSSSGGPTDYTEIILDCGAVPRLKELVVHNNREIQKEACWTLSNIAAGTVDQIQAVIDSGAIPPLVKLVGKKTTDQEVRSEACWVVLNATSCGSDSQIEVLVDEGCVSVLGVLLGEASMVMMALEGLERVLQVEESREAARREQVENGEIGEDEEDNPSLVSASLIEKALEKHNSSAVTKRANRIWKQHFVSCALCNQSFSKHRTSDATFCDECKCYVCSSCDCQMYHLSYQEELWAVNEEETEAKKSAKKSKKQKKKEKQKQKKAKQQFQPQATSPPTDSAASKDANSTPSRSYTAGSSPDTESAEVNIPSESTPQKAQSTPAKAAPVEASQSSSKKKGNGNSANVDKGKKKEHNRKGSSSSSSSGSEEANSDIKNFAKVSPSDSDEPDKDEEEGGVAKSTTSRGDSGGKPPVDFVMYLQETGSIIALAKLMDTLDYGDSSDYEMDDTDAQLMSRHQQMLNEQATT